MHGLPHTIVDMALQRPNGELAWRREHAGSALVAIAQAGLACLGGELWIVDGDRIMPWYKPVLPSGAHFYRWDTQAKRDEEPWPAYVARCRDESLNAIQSFSSHDVAEPPGDVYFNLCYISEAELQDLRSSMKK